jgi:hypothetical protein
MVTIETMKMSLLLFVSEFLACGRSSDSYSYRHPPESARLSPKNRDEVEFPVERRTLNKGSGVRAVWTSLYPTPLFQTI